MEKHVQVHQGQEFEFLEHRIRVIELDGENHDITLGITAPVTVEEVATPKQP